AACHRHSITLLQRFGGHADLHKFIPVVHLQSPLLHRSPGLSDLDIQERVWVHEMKLSHGTFNRYFMAAVVNTCNRMMTECSIGRDSEQAEECHKEPSHAQILSR